MDGERRLTYGERYGRWRRRILGDEVWRRPEAGHLRSPKDSASDLAVPRLAIRTEDHPLEYADFEGVIPEGQYGARTVMVWDNGTYEVSNGLSAEQHAQGRGPVCVAPTRRRTVPPVWIRTIEGEVPAPPAAQVLTSLLDKYAPPEKGARAQSDLSVSN